MTDFRAEVFFSADDEGWIARIPALPGCSAFGETREQALFEFEIAQRLWIQSSLTDSIVGPNH